MPRHDYFCSICGQLFVDVVVPAKLGASAGRPWHCSHPTSWIPQVQWMDAKEPFQRFTTRDGQNHEVVVDSVHKLREIERQSEQQYRNGEGQPLVWRHYSNDRSNRDVHALHPNWSAGERPDPAWVKQHGDQLKKFTEDPGTDYGPGISDATPCGLDHLDGWRG